MSPVSNYGLHRYLLWIYLLANHETDVWGWPHAGWGLSCWEQVAICLHAKLHEAISEHSGNHKTQYGTEGVDIYSQEGFDEPLLTWRCRRLCGKEYEWPLKAKIVPCGQPSSKQGVRSYNHKEINSATNKNELGSRFPSQGLKMRTQPKQQETEPHRAGLLTSKTGADKRILFKLLGFW